MGPLCGLRLGQNASLTLKQQQRLFLKHPDYKYLYEFFRGSAATVVHIHKRQKGIRHIGKFVLDFTFGKSNMFSKRPPVIAFTDLQ